MLPQPNTSCSFLHLQVDPVTACIYMITHTHSICYIYIYINVWPQEPLPSLREYQLQVVPPLSGQIFHVGSLSFVPQPYGCWWFFVDSPFGFTRCSLCASTSFTLIVLLKEPKWVLTVAWTCSTDHLHLSHPKVSNENVHQNVT